MTTPMSHSAAPSGWRFHDLHESSLFGLKSRRRLAELLRRDLPALKSLSALSVQQRYCTRPNTKKGKTRMVQVPRRELKHVHRRLFCLLNRLITPSFVHSGKRGHSYLTNAAAHIKCNALFKIDIKRFFESVLWVHVFSFFKDTMDCSADVAGLLADLCTVERTEVPVNGPTTRDRHLPTGSPISQCLAFWCFAEMFGDIRRLAEARGLTLTLFVDDVVLSGERVSRATQSAVRDIIARRGLVGHKERYYTKNALVTGAIVTPRGLLLPNSRRLDIRMDILRLKTLKKHKSQVAHLRTLVGKLFSAAEMDPKLRAPGKEHSAKLQLLYQQYPRLKPRVRNRCARAWSVPTATHELRTKFETPAAPLACS